MTAFICITCGTQYPPADAPPASCPICQDERQYVRAAGQEWATPEELRRDHWNGFRLLEPGLFGIGSFPTFAIGQRALLVCTPSGNVLWDCISLLDAATVAIIEALGGLAAIAISHPHYYTTMAEWAAAFGVRVHLHTADRKWVMRPDPALEFWDGTTQALLPGLTLIRTGGHFAGGTVLHWAAGSGGAGALLSGDILQVAPDRRHVSFLRSYPNMVPLSAPAIDRLIAAVAPFRYARVYGAFWHSLIPEDGTEAVARSAARYLAAIGGDGSAEFD